MDRTGLGFLHENRDAYFTHPHILFYGNHLTNNEKDAIVETICTRLGLSGISHSTFTPNIPRPSPTPAPVEITGTPTMETDVEIEMGDSE